MMLWTWFACAPPCPEGLTRQAGRCLPSGTGTPTGDAPPLDEATFQDRYDDDLCDELEDCVCDALDADTCDADIECPRTSWPTGCAFNPVLAADCLSGTWDCNPDPDGPVVTPPDVCVEVYACGGGSGGSDSGTR